MKGDRVRVQDQTQKLWGNLFLFCSWTDPYRDFCVNFHKRLSRLHLSYRFHAELWCCPAYPGNGNAFLSDVEVLVQDLEYCKGWSPCMTVIFMRDYWILKEKALTVKMNKTGRRQNKGRIKFQKQTVFTIASQMEGGSRCSSPKS